MNSVSKSGLFSQFTYPDLKDASGQLLAQLAQTQQKFNDFDGGNNEGNDSDALREHKVEFLSADSRVLLNVNLWNMSVWWHLDFDTIGIVF